MYFSFKVLLILFMYFINLNGLKCHFQKSTIAENIYRLLFYIMAFPGGSVVKNQPADAGDARDSGSTPGLGRSPGGGTGTQLLPRESQGQNNWAGTSP